MVDASPGVVHRPRDDSSSSFVTPTAAPPILTGRGRFGLWRGTFGDAQTNSANEDTMNERKKMADPHGNLRRVLDAYGVNAQPRATVRQMWDAAMGTVTSVELGEALGAAEALVTILRERVAKDRDVCVRCMGEGVVGMGEKCPSTIHAAS